MAPSSKSYIFDLGEWEHFTQTVLPEWINNTSKYDGLVVASTIDELLIIPLTNFVEQAHKRKPDTNLTEAGSSLLNYLEYDLKSKFRDNQIVVIEQIDTLRSFVEQFLAIYGAGEYLKKSKNNTIAASKDRKCKPNKKELEAYKENYFADNGKYQGWIKEACRKYDLSTNTIKTILKTQ